MSALSNRIADEHRVYRVYVHDDLACKGCNWTWQRPAGSDHQSEAETIAAARHIAQTVENEILTLATTTLLERARQVEASYQHKSMARAFRQASRLVRNLT